MGVRLLFGWRTWVPQKSAGATMWQRQACMMTIGCFFFTLLLIGFATGKQQDNNNRKKRIRTHRTSKEEEQPESQQSIVKMNMEQLTSMNVNLQPSLTPPQPCTRKPLTVNVFEAGCKKRKIETFGCHGNCNGVEGITHACTRCATTKFAMRTVHMHCPRL